MSKKRDPIVSVLNYFSSAELALAEQGLELAKEIVRKRRPVSRAATKKPTPPASTKRPAAAPATTTAAAN